MIKVVVLGAGNLASHLIEVFEKSKELTIVQVYNRSAGRLSYIKGNIPVTTDIRHLEDADIYILCLADDAIEEVSEMLPFTNKLIVHTSGTVPLNAINNKNRRGVFYPLQSFTTDKKVDFTAIPICLEAENTEDMSTLKNLAGGISNHSYEINSKQRKVLHLAAVFVNNFTNHLFYIGSDICKTHQIPFKILHPLIHETAEKLKDLSPYDAQTGPARRNDIKTINSHLNQLDNNTQKEIYKLLTQSIQKAYGREKL